ncbi:hypothetical protein [Pseudarthrobacter sp. LT1]|uniref:hypothetical protein n=1 Tax=Pseudarthrobacter sp. LT1 TaxID=3111450 RepID=UPI002D787C86|nr:hypothetical protein [Pseudarthrobacter sp. LT1]WRT15636.1 hypothetical protein VIK36_09235 [Pseudarthrobacter sp. LT1]
MAKGNSALDDRELRAAQAVRAVYGAATWQIVPKDIVSAPPGTHDFDLYDGTMTVAVEVSTIARTDTVRDSAEWDRHFPDLAIRLEGITKGWVVMVASGGSVRTTRQQLGVWLADLERMQMFSARTERWQEHAFDPEPYRPPWVDTLRAMRAAGVIHAVVEPTLPAGECALSKVDDGYAWDPSDYEYVSTFVSEQLAGDHKSDVRKLERAIADRRVLFLWLDAQSHFDITRRLDNHVLGGSVRNAGSVDEVWIGRHFKDGAVTAYRWCPAKGWSTIDLAKSDLVDT